MTVDNKSQGSEYCMLDGSNESQQGKDESANTVLVKLMMDTGAFRIWIPAATYEAVMEAVESTGVAGKNPTILYVDEDGDRCVLSEKTFVDCASLAKNRFKLWVQKADAESEKKCGWAEMKSMWAAKWAEKKSMWAEKKKNIYMAGYKAGYEAGLQKGAEVVMGESEGKADDVVDVEAEAAASAYLAEEDCSKDGCDMAKWKDMWKGWGKECSTDAESWPEGDWKGAWKGKGKGHPMMCKGKGKGKAMMMHLLHNAAQAAHEMHEMHHAAAHARAHEQAMAGNPEMEHAEYPAWGGKGYWGGKGHW